MELICALPSLERPKNILEEQKAYSSKESCLPSFDEIASVFCLWLGSGVQRLFSMFPAGAPGFALLVIRCCIATALASIAFPAGWRHIAFMILLGMLCLGMFTPLVCIAATLVVLLALPHHPTGNITEMSLILLCTSSFALLGPGAFSIDAKLFGRRVVLSDRSSRSSTD
jgi:hypothetical protein